MIVSAESSVSTSAANITLGELFDTCGDGMMTVADQGGHIRSISEVPSGIACACTCPCCGRDLVARKGKMKSHHFAHRANEEEGTCRHAAETILHRYAKQVIQREGAIRIPGVTVSDDLGPLEVTGDTTVRLDNVRLEKRMGEIVPDVTADASGRPLLIEFFVTHKCSDEKLAFLAGKDIGVVEVDLTKYRAVRLCDLDHIIISAAPRAMLFGRQFSKGSAMLQERRRSFMAGIEEACDDYSVKLTGLRKVIIRYRRCWFDDYKGSYLGAVIASSPDPLNFFYEPDPYWKSRVLRLFLRDRRKKWHLQDLLKAMGDPAMLTHPDEQTFYRPIADHLRSARNVDAATAQDAVLRFVDHLRAKHMLNVDENGRYIPSPAFVSPHSRKSRRTWAPTSTTYWWNQDD